MFENCNMFGNNINASVCENVHDLNIWQSNPNRIHNAEKLDMENNNSKENIDERSCNETNSEEVSSEGSFNFNDVVKTEIKRQVWVVGEDPYVKCNTKGFSGEAKSDSDNGQVGEGKPIKQFLKRGDGLKQRFKVDPDAFKLKNLPKYKFAGSHPHLKTQSFYKKPLNFHKAAAENRIINSARSSQNNQCGEDQEYKDFSNISQSLISASKVCSSTPESKSSGYGSVELKGTEKVKETKGEKAHQNVQFADNLESMALSSKNKGVSLPSQTYPDVIEPVDITATCTSNEMNQTQMEMDTLKRFEYLEQQVCDQSYESDSSYMERVWMKSLNLRDLQSDGMETSEVYNRSSTIMSTGDFYATDEDPNGQAEQSSTVDSSTAPPSVKEDVKYGGDMGSNDPYEDFEVDSQKTDGSVLEHFREVLFNLLNERAKEAAEAEKRESHQDDDTAENTIIDLEPETERPYAIDGKSSSFENLSLTEQVESVKRRNEKLKEEVLMFKEANKKLTKMKQEFELEKTLFEQERNEAALEMEDIRIKFEMYMHDERNKLEEEKRKMEQQIKTQRLTKQNKDRLTIIQLKEEVDKLKEQLKQKELNHTAAQARLRAQLTKTEKEHKATLDELEELKKTNKRLETEVIRIEREKNNKLLEEINKNIAKLAPKTDDFEVANASKDKSKPPAKKIPMRFGNPSFRAKEPDLLKKHQARKPDTRRNNSPCDGSSEEDLMATLSQENPPNSINSSLVEVAATESKTFADKLCGPESPKTLNTSTSTTGIPQEERGTANVSASTSTEFNREIINPDGTKDIWYSNGNIKKLSADRMHIKMLYFNKDIKETDIEKGTVKYYYASTNTWHTTYLDGLEILEFPNGQVEHRFKNGIIETHFPNNSIKIFDPNNKEVASEWRFEDGTKLIHMHNGDKVLVLANGQREIHTQLCKRREFPDGTIKILYPDGSQETRYSNGRIRFKDRNGKLIMDSDNSVRL